MSELRVLDTLTIVDEDGTILSTVMKPSPEGQVILALQERLAAHEGGHTHDPSETPFNPEHDESGPTKK